MLKNITGQQILPILEKDHPDWERHYRQEEAQRLCNQLDARFEAPLTRYLRDGYMENVSYGGFDVYLIMSMQKCSYLDAIVMLNLYIRDPQAGRNRIMRPRDGR